jgi:ASC-1-like (ASCH) protein
MNIKEVKLKIIAAGHKAVEQLIKVAEEDIIKMNSDDDLSADKLKNAAMSKKLAIFDAFEILSRIELERENIDSMDRGISKTDTKQGFAERRSK